MVSVLVLNEHVFTILKVAPVVNFAFVTYSIGLFATSIYLYNLQILEAGNQQRGLGFGDTLSKSKLALFIAAPSENLAIRIERQNVLDSSGNLHYRSALYLIVGFIFGGELNQIDQIFQVHLLDCILLQIFPSELGGVAAPAEYFSARRHQEIV